MSMIVDSPGLAEAAAPRVEAACVEAPRAGPSADAALMSTAKPLVTDLFNPGAAIYWTDLLLCVAVAYPSFYFAHDGSLPWAVRGALFLLSALAFYRAVLFTHELVHLREPFNGFRFAWNLFCGIPLLVPSFLYYTHLDHHRPAHYATDKDGEYLPLARGPVLALVWFLGQNVFVPAIVVLRFTVLTPLAWISCKLRRLIHRYASAMVIDPSYARPEPSSKQRKIWRMQEVMCLVYLLSIAALVATGNIHWSWILQAYVLAVFVLMINGVRTLVAHRYRHETDEPLSLVEQLLDSINHPHHPLLTELWAPVGLRFHALHHLFPGLPYHALPEAHRRLMAKLPEASPYREVNSPGLFASFRQLWRFVRGRPQRGRGFHPCERLQD
jgi:fatty acid desaturase